LIKSLGVNTFCNDAALSNTVNPGIVQRLKAILTPFITPIYKTLFARALGFFRSSIIVSISPDIAHVTKVFTAWKTVHSTIILAANNKILQPIVADSIPANIPHTAILPTPHEKAMTAILIRI